MTRKETADHDPYHALRFGEFRWFLLYASALTIGTLIQSVVITSSNEIGAFESGLAAKLMGLVPSVIFGGLMTLGVVGLTTWKAPELRKLNRM